ncbi:MAG: ferritin family protein [Bacteroidales bacterium]
MIPILTCCGGGGREEKTRENLLEAYHGESTVRAKYLDYASLAEEEALPEIALMFKALAKSEEIHANNHRAALASMGFIIATPVIADYRRGVTELNIEVAIQGELYEVDTMYAAFVKNAEKENNAIALEAFTWALDTEKKHAVQLRDALDILTGESTAVYPAVWHVCRKCGNTFSDEDIEDPCPFCETPADEFILFKRE